MVIALVRCIGFGEFGARVVEEREAAGRWFEVMVLMKFEGRDLWVGKDKRRGRKLRGEIGEGGNSDMYFGFLTRGLRLGADVIQGIGARILRGVLIRRNDGSTNSRRLQMREWTMFY